MRKRDYPPALATGADHAVGTPPGGPRRGSCHRVAAVPQPRDPAQLARRRRGVAAFRAGPRRPLDRPALGGPGAAPAAPRASAPCPGRLTAVFAAAAAGAGVNASLFAYFLPPGVNDRLIKAAIWLSVAAIVGFYTALLHSLHHRPHGARSRLLFLAIAGASVFAVLERREAFRPPVFNPPQIADLSPSRTAPGPGGRPAGSLTRPDPAARRAGEPPVSRVRAARRQCRPARRHLPRTALRRSGRPWRRASSRSGMESWTGRPGRPASSEKARRCGSSRPVPACRCGPSASVADGRSTPRTLQALPVWSALGRVGLEVATIDMPLTAPPDHDTRWVFSDGFFSGDRASGDEPLAALARRFEVSRRDLPARDAGGGGLAGVARGAGRGRLAARRGAPAAGGSARARRAPAPSAGARSGRTRSLRRVRGEPSSRARAAGG